MGGFTAFITWSYQPDHTELGGSEATGVDYLRTLAIARLVLDNFDNLQASWVTQGGKVGQLSLAFGANDMGSVMIEENVVRAAGAGYCMDEIEIVRNIENAGFIAKRRNMHYEVLGDPIFRERRCRGCWSSRLHGRTGTPRARLKSVAMRPGVPPRRRRGSPAIDRSIARAWVLPIAAPPIRAGGSLIDGGRIVDVFDAVARSRSMTLGRCETIDLGDVAILPGLVNAHTHLELSWMRGRIPPSDSMPAWAAQLIALRREQECRSAGADRDRHRGSACRGHRAGRRRDEHARGRSAARREPAGWRRVLRDLGFSAPTPDRTVAGARRRSMRCTSHYHGAVPGPARAIFRVAGVVPSDCGRRRRSSGERPRRRVARGDGVSSNRHWRVA